MGKSIDPVQRLAAEIADMKEQIKALQTAPRLQNSSITKGRVRFIGGELLIDSGGELNIDGSATVDGTMEVAGTATVDGTLNIDGTATVDGTLTVPGTLPIVLQIVGGKPRVTVGGGFLEGYDDGAILGKSGGGGVTVTTDGVAMFRGSSGIGALADGLYVTGVADAASSTGMKLLAIDGDGKVWTVAGGGGSGVYRFPFARSTHTTYPGHSGADWARPAGTGIRAIGPGTVVERYTYGGNTYPFDSSEPIWRGHCVVIDHGTIGGRNIRSLYAHMLNPPSVDIDDVVTGGQIIGGVGNTGYSDGNHLHFEIIYDGVRLGTGEGGYERTMTWLDANTDGSSWA